MWWRMLVYNLVVFFVFLASLPWAAYQVLFVKKRREGIAQRLGAVPGSDGKVVWCHAVSVGEVRAVTPMLSLLQEDGQTAGRLVLSTVTPTGQDTARRECGFVRSIFFFPFDLPFLAKKALGRLDPEVFITAETEIWPNFFQACFRKRVPVIVVNGRISDRSFTRYMKFRWFFRPVLEKVTLFLMQSEEDARRIREMGARPEAIQVTGNTKYDRQAEPVVLPGSVESWARSRFLLVAGSTHAGEEEVLLNALDRLKDSGVGAAIVPRHPERFDEVAGLLERRGQNFERFSHLGDGRKIEALVLLVDAMGVLDGFYALADAAFVGGSLVPTGGHNLAEPAMHGVPVLTGPSLHNFRDMAETLISSGKCMVIENSEELVRAVEVLVRGKDLSGGKRNGSEVGSVGLGGASARNTEYVLGVLYPGPS